MLLYQWTSTEPEQHNKDTGEEDTKGTKDTRDASQCSENQEGHKSIGHLTNTPHQEGHALNVDRWATLPGTAQRKGNRKISISLTTTTRNQSGSHLSLYQGITWPR